MILDEEKEQYRLRLTTTENCGGWYLLVIPTYIIKSI